MQIEHRTGRVYDAPQTLVITVPALPDDILADVAVMFVDASRHISGSVTVMAFEANRYEIGRAVLREYDAGRYQLA
jgi:hypothetical protein